MALRHQRSPAASEADAHFSMAACTVSDGLTVLHDLHSIPIPSEYLSKPGHFGVSGGIDRLG
jgi:hypothetical protein